MDISVLGVDLGKNICSVVGLDGSGAVVMRRKVRRETLIALAEKLPACIVGMEACCGAHHLGRVFAAHGHGSSDATDDALCRTEEPGSARHAEPASITRPAGRRADGSD